MRNLPAMGLIMWDQLTDPYDHVELASNMAKIDQHDHTPGRGIQLTTQSFAPESITSAQLANNSITSAKIENGTIQVADLATSLQNKVATSRKSLKIDTEESRTNTAFGLLPTPDQVEVTLSENGILVVGYQATWQQSVESTARADIFLNGVQLQKAFPNENAVSAAGMGSAIAKWATLGTSSAGLVSQGAEGGGYPGDVATGQIIGGGNSFWGLCFIFAAPATYKVSIQFRSTPSGTVTVKKRKLWVEARSFAE